MAVDIKTVVKSIVEHQQLVIGPLAVEQANKVAGISISYGANLQVKVTGSDTEKILTELVSQYEQLFGRASVEVCRDAVKEIKPKVDSAVLPQILQ